MARNTVMARALAIAVIQYRTQHGLSQRQLAEQLGMAHAQVARLELGEHNPSIETLHRISKALDTRLILDIIPPGRLAEAALPPGAEVLAGTDLADGTRVRAAKA